MKSLLTSLFVIIIQGIFFVPSSAQLGGISYVTSNCASGGFDYYFFDDGSVIGECFGCEYVPYYSSGTYRITGSTVSVRITEDFFGKGRGEVVHVSSINHYETYDAKYEKSNETFTIPYSYFTDGIDDSCEQIGTHDHAYGDPHIFLRSGMPGRYPVSCQRLLTDTDLKDLSKKELRIMRNEIYARYGYVFSSADLREHFKKDPNYREFSKDVEAFLSEIEKANVKKIQAFERK